MNFSLARAALLLFIICTVTTFIFAFHGYPLFLLDSGCFLPTSYFINHSHQLINPFYDAGIDVTQHRFIFYPPLFPYVVALISGLLPGQFTSIPVALTIIDDAAIALILFSIYHYAKARQIQTNWVNYIFVFVFIVALFSFQGISRGRPEILSRMLIAGFLLNNLINQKTAPQFINGLLLGLSLVTSPIPAIYLALVNAIILAYKNQFKVKPIVITAIGVFLVLGCFVLLYPYPINELISGMRTHSANVIFNRFGSDYLHSFTSRHITAADTPLSIFTFTIAFVCLLVYLLRKKQPLTVFFVGLLTLSICYFSFKDFQMSYNLYVLSPLCLFLIAIIFIENDNGKPRQQLLQIVLIIMLLGNGMGFIRRTVIFFKVKNDLVSATHFRANFLNTLKQAKPGKKVVVSNGLWLYTLDQASRVQLYRTGSMDYIYRDTTIQFLLIQQSNSGQLTPAQHPGFKLVKNEYTTNNIRLWKIPLGNTYPGYQIAIYKRL